MGHTVEDVNAGGGKEAPPALGRGRRLTDLAQLTFQFSAFILVRTAIAAHSGTAINVECSYYTTPGSCPHPTATDTCPPRQSS